MAYPPLPRDVIKEESLEEETANQLIAYLPIPRGRIKEELQSDVNISQDGFNLEEHQVLLGFMFEIYMMGYTSGILFSHLLVGLGASCSVSSYTRSL